MENVILIWRMFNTSFSFILYTLQVMEVFLSSSEHYRIIVSAVILNPNISLKSVASTYFLDEYYYLLMGTKCVFRHWDLEMFGLRIELEGCGLQ